ncbi:hypothetical protein [Leucothrix arctica]|uniref:Uncharacterized protein n=1 Tax=Leucothrix arctica TaxID=1481894 RepID=A0A317CJS2_9GAMM|nr:hypothetical protein [Leucothrix arctica]PWQ98808.1 hypothetical protein DKT75_03110 [Leucothrix arctica]
MPSTAIANPTTSASTPWLWPLLILLIIAIPTGVIVYSQKISKQVDSIEQEQVSQYQSRDYLLAQSDALNINWMRTLNSIAKDIKGDIVWSTSIQKGIMRFVNLPKLPSDRQYHLLAYDLQSSSQDPISIVKFTPEIKVPTEMLVPFTTDRTIGKPYKFMVMLDYKDSSLTDEPLLLAQP